MRLPGFLFNNPEIQLFASSETDFQTSRLNSIFLDRIFLKTSFEVFAIKGGFPDSAQYVITPKLQLSHLQSYFCLMTSGAINAGVPTNDFNVITSNNTNNE